VVWEGRSREAPPYPDPWPKAEITAARRGGRFLGHFRRRGDAAPDDGGDSLTQAHIGVRY